MTTLYKPRPERWFRFSVRMMFVFVTLLGVFLSWLAVQVKWIRDRHEAMKWAESHPGSRRISTIHSVDAPWSIRILGEPSGPAEMGVTALTPDDMKQVETLKRLFPERGLYVNYALRRSWD